MNEEKDVSKTDTDRENEVRDLEPAKDAKGGGGVQARQRLAAAASKSQHHHLLRQDNKGKRAALWLKP